MHLQENTLFDFDPKVKVTQNIAQYSLHHVIYAYTKFEFATTNSLGEDAFTIKYIIGPYYEPSTFYAPAKFGVATSNSSGGGAFTRKYII